jgi:hypothetical protein
MNTLNRISNKVDVLQWKNSILFNSRTLSHDVDNLDMKSATRIVDNINLRILIGHDLRQSWERLELHAQYKTPFFFNR